MSTIASEYELDYFSLSFENDAFYDEDGGYSHGMAFSWGYYDIPSLDKSSLPNWLSYLAKHSYLDSFSDRNYSIHYTIGQYIQTSSNINIKDLVITDPPYAGLLAWQGTLGAYDNAVYDNLSLAIGIVGPITGAEYTQKYWHKWIDTVEPVGWDNQLHNEVVFRVQAERLWENFSLPIKETEVNLSSGINAGFGNLLSDLNVGASLYWGKNLGSSFPPNSPFILQKLNHLNTSYNGWYIFVNVFGSYVAHDIFINGNTLKSSHNVELIPWYIGVAGGLQAHFNGWNVSWTMLSSSDQYKNQSEKSRWGNISLIYHF